MDKDTVNVDELELQRDVPGLIEALRHPEERTRVRTAHALERVGDEQAIPALTVALQDEAATDPAELFRGNAAWEESGSTDLIYYVRKAAWEALTAIWNRTITAFEEFAEGTDPFQVGDIVAQCRVYPGGSLMKWTEPLGSEKAARWKVLFISKREVALELVEGVHEEKKPNHKHVLHYPGYVARIGSSEEFQKLFGNIRATQYAFSAFKKVKKS